MTTEASPPPPADSAGAGYEQMLERLVQLHLSRLRAWTALPSERVDWELENLLEELAAAAKTLRAVRTDDRLPF